MISLHSSRRSFLKSSIAATIVPFLHPIAVGATGVPASRPAIDVDPRLARQWLSLWEPYIRSEARDRACDREMGEELGWLVSPFLSGFYYGYLATQDTKWLDLLVDWADAWTARGIKEPDGYVGWPKEDGASTGAVASLFTDNILGEAMALRPMTLFCHTVRQTPSLHEKYAAKASHYLQLAEDVFEKWDSRCCWRQTARGGVWVVPEFGIGKNKQWTGAYARRTTEGFSLPANKQNLVSLWLLALHDVTGKATYRDRAEKWHREMKSRIRLRAGKYYEWNYWDPAGPWDYKADGSTRHWVGVHPNGGYYGIDLEGVVAAYEHGLVFDKQDIERLIATNRDFMWNGKIQGAQFKRIDGGEVDSRWKNSPGVLWEALIPYDPTLRRIFEVNHKPDSWGGLASTPWYVWSYYR